MQNLIFDFDGTMTDLDQEAAPVIDSFRQGLEEHLGESLDARINKTHQEMLPGDSWYVNGHPAVRWDADPYVQISTVADRIYEELSDDDAQQRAQALTALFRNAQNANGQTHWRTNVKQFLQRAPAHVNLAVVTNSETASVEEKLAGIGQEDIPVIGDAKKYVLSDTPEEQKHGPRTIRLDRPHYRGLLEELAQEHGFTPETTVVAGDIYEFDLAVPQALGYGIILAWPHGDAQHDIRAVKKYPRGRVVDNYTDLLRHATDL